MREEELIVVTAFTASLLLSALLIWFFISYQKRKNEYVNSQKDAQLREQELIIQNQLNLENERNRIASEMHDDLGSGLTVIKYLSDNIVSNTFDITIKEDVNKIATYSTVLVKNMSEIIWAMNSRFDNVQGLISYLRRFSVEFLDDNNVSNTFKENDLNYDINISGEKRRNLFLVVKELLHNSVKYSKAKEINISITGQPDLEIVIIEKQSVGFDPLIMKEKGNGLFNIEKRMANIDGKISYKRKDNDMIIKIFLHLEPDIKTNVKSE